MKKKTPNVANEWIKEIKDRRQAAEQRAREDAEFETKARQFYEVSVEGFWRDLCKKLTAAVESYNLDLDPKQKVRANVEPGGNKAFTALKNYYPAGHLVCALDAHAWMIEVGYTFRANGDRPPEEYIRQYAIASNGKALTLRHGENVVVVDITQQLLAPYFERI